MGRRWAVLGVALALTACGGDGASETTTTAAAPATTTTTSSSTTTTSTTLMPVLTESDTVTTAGLGPVRIGMTVEEAQQAAGRVMPAEGTGGSGECFYVRPEGLEGVGLMVTDDAIARVDITSGPITTRSGARIGMTEKEIKDLFPGQIEVEPHKYVDGGHYLIFVPRDPSDADYRVVFETDGTVVTSYRAGILPEVEWVEGCS